MSFSTEMLFFLPGIIMSMQFPFLDCKSQFGKSWSGISDGDIQPTVIGHIGDVQGNLITAEIWQGSLRGGDCTDRRGAEQHEKGKLLLFTFLWARWSSERSSSPVRKRCLKRAANRTIDFVTKVSTFLVPKPACDLSQNDNWLDLGWGGTRDDPVQGGRPSRDFLLYFLMTAACSG